MNNPTITFELPAETATNISDFTTRKGAENWDIVLNAFYKQLGVWPVAIKVANVPGTGITLPNKAHAVS